MLFRSPGAGLAGADRVKLVGTREVDAVSTGQSSSRHGLSRSRTTSTRLEVIMPAQEIRMLPRGYALVIMGESRAAVVKYKKGQVRAERELAALRKRKAKQQSTEQPSTPDIAPQVFGDSLLAVPDLPRQQHDECVSGAA